MDYGKKNRHSSLKLWRYSAMYYTLFWVPAALKQWNFIAFTFHQTGMGGVKKSGVGFCLAPFRHVYCIKLSFR
jgi:hypothetical protein